MDAGASAGGRVGESLQDVGERKPNPPLSESTLKWGFESQNSSDSLDESRCYARNCYPTPSGSEESSGRLTVSVP